MTKRLRPLLAVDLDGSVIRVQMLVLLFKYCIHHGIFQSSIARQFDGLCLAQRDRAITFPMYDAQLITLFVASVKDVSQAKIDVAARSVFENDRDWLYMFSKALIAELRPTYDIVTVSGAMHEVVKYMAPYWGIKHFYCTELEVDEQGCYTGRDRSVPVNDKGKALRGHMANAKGVTWKHSVALGDTASDIPMLELVDHPIAFNPKGKLREVAVERNWPIVLERGDGIYVLHHSIPGGWVAFHDSEAAEAVRLTLSLAVSKHKRRRTA